ncbi:flavodoxin [Alteromonadaceae bacterium 2753L.S.0a.02]|nr:flavodoxin [Alteromonadaceae bacterium 2753L.S.0a.02]
MSNFLIVVGTVNGHSLEAAYGAAALLQKLGHSVKINQETTVADLTRDPSEIILVCCSTTDKGKMPLNIYPLYRALDDNGADLSNRLYGVIALGDSYFPPSQYAMGGIIFENALYSCGAKRVGDIALLDAQHVQNYSVAAAMWVQTWVRKVTEAEAA